MAYMYMYLVIIMILDLIYSTCNYKSLEILVRNILVVKRFIISILNILTINYMYNVHTCTCTCTYMHMYMYIHAHVHLQKLSSAIQYIHLHKLQNQFLAHKVIPTIPFHEV